MVKPGIVWFCPINSLHSPETAMCFYELFKMSSEHIVLGIGLHLWSTWELNQYNDYQWLQYLLSAYHLPVSVSQCFPCKILYLKQQDNLKAGMVSGSFLKHFSGNWEETCLSDLALLPKDSIQSTTWLWVPSLNTYQMHKKAMRKHSLSLTHCISLAKGWELFCINWD